MRTIIIELLLLIRSLSMPRVFFNSSRRSYIQCMIKITIFLSVSGRSPLNKSCLHKSSVASIGSNVCSPWTDVDQVIHTFHQWMPCDAMSSTKGSNRRATGCQRQLATLVTEGRATVGDSHRPSPTARRWPGSRAIADTLPLVCWRPNY